MTAEKPMPFWRTFYNQSNIAFVSELYRYEHQQQQQQKQCLFQQKCKSQISPESGAGCERVNVLLG